MEKGDIVEVEYDAYIKETNELIDTTHEALAKEKEVYNEGVEYKPQPMIVGTDKNIVKGLAEHLQTAEQGKDLQVEIPPEQGYGARNPKLIELHALREIMRLPEFSKGDVYPYVGMTIYFRNRPATITAVTAGRVRLDFNHKFAGKTLVYKYKIVSTISEPGAKIKAIMDRIYPSKEPFGVAINGDVAEIKLPDICKYDTKWTLAKYQIIGDLREIAKVTTIRFVEEYVKKEAEKAEAVKEGKPDAPTEEKKEDGHDHDGHDHHDHEEGHHEETHETDKPKKEAKSEKKGSKGKAKPKE